eukprot:Pgem_evm1s4165
MFLIEENPGSLSERYRVGDVQIERFTQSDLVPLPSAFPQLFIVNNNPKKKNSVLYPEHLAYANL